MLRVINCEALNCGWLEVVDHGCSLGDVLWINCGLYEVYGIAWREDSTTVLVEVVPYVENVWTQLSIFGEE